MNHYRSNPTSATSQLGDLEQASSPLGHPFPSLYNGIKKTMSYRVVNRIILSIHKHLMNDIVIVIGVSITG